MLGERQLAWAKERNAECIAQVGDPAATERYTRILGILDSKDKIPSVSRIGDAPTPPAPVQHRRALCRAGPR